MKIPVKRFELTTKRRNQLLNISALINQAIHDSGILEGICVIHNPHTTAALTINENADPDVCTDMEAFLEKLIPPAREFRHSEGNSDSHIKTSLVGPSLTLIIEKGQPILGTWQGIYFCEFDGPRQRHFYVKCMEG